MGAADDDPTRLQLEVERLSRAERLLHRLVAVSGELAAADTRDTIARIVIDRGFEAVEASYGALWLLDDARTGLELLGSSRLPRGTIDRWAMVPLELDAPMPWVVRTGEPLYLSLAEYEARFPTSFLRMRDTISSPAPAYAMLPLDVRGERLGALSATYEHGAILDTSERRFLAILAAHCAQALERVRAQDQLARAYREEREAHLLAEEATRAREEILAVVSHDLRNPLGTVLMGSSTLAATTSDPRVRTIADRITRQTERMTRLIDDLVDFTGLRAGAIVLERRTQPVDRIIADATDLCGPLAEERELSFLSRVEPALPDVSCDAQRVVQAIANLCSIAIKATPRKGEIAIGAVGDARGVELFVRDTGPGFSEADVAQLFAPQWRSTHAMYKGAGVRLAIVKAIVDAHGGRVRVESRPGTGTTVSFTLTGPSPEATIADACPS